TYTFAAPEEVPNGPWVDEIIFFAEEDLGKVKDMLLKGDMNIYFVDIRDPQIFDEMKKSPKLAYKFAFGGNFELSPNPAEFETGEFNPFVNARIREALNYIIDRNYVIDEILAGLGLPKFLPITTYGPDYALIADVAIYIENKYSYDFEKGREIIFEEMKKMGAELKDGKWYYNGKPVVIKFVIRSDPGDPRKQMGDYISSQLEKLGFTVERMYKTKTEASPIVFQSAPEQGLWHLYTGGWIGGLSRDEGWTYLLFYAPDYLGAYYPLWNAYKIEPEDHEVFEKLWFNEYSSYEEKAELLAKASAAAIKYSYRVWIIDQIQPFVYRKEIKVAADLGSGFSSVITARTLRYKDKVGGTIKAGNQAFFVEPWNPIAGTNWMYDRIVINFLREPVFISNPYTAISMPNRVEELTLYLQKDIPVIQVADWYKLEKVDKVEVPADAWYAFDPINEKVITAGEAGVKYAKAKVVANFGDMIGKMEYHDGTNMSLGDWLLQFSLAFARANPDHPLYDENYVQGLNLWRRTFVAWRIVSEHPLIIEVYHNYTALEAWEIAVAHVDDFFPDFPWHGIALGMIGEEKGELAFSRNKAQQTGAEWMNYVAGESLSKLVGYIDEAIAEKYIPFKKFLSQYITEDEAVERYNAIKAWYDKHGHLWVQCGPYYLDTVDVNAKQAVLKAFRKHPDKADKWSWLAEPPVPQAKLEGPDTILTGLGAQFKLTLTMKNKPYPNDRIKEVKYLVIDSGGNIVAKRTSSALDDGVWAIDIPSELSSTFSPGTYTLFVIAVSKDVAMPSVVKKSFAVQSLSEYINSLVSEIETKVNAKISSLENGVNSLNSEVQSLKETISSLQASINTLTTLSAVSLIIAIIAIILSLRKQKISK
ncbi:MAG TPA: ABC transporter substrate-binding protein, partial [Candidatus Bathyarchaeota archaeon]|nr:ABC transporter substrate-binding protein [Candidatus Bathyarchaeota archaeon]